MRDLTQKEIDDKPEWATSYLVPSANSYHTTVCYADKSSMIALWSCDDETFPLLINGEVYLGLKDIQSKAL